MAADERTILLWPDTHAPYHDRRSVALLLDVLASVQPDEVLLLGDFIDAKAPARWSKAKAEEFAADLPRELEAGKKILADIRNVHDGALTYIQGNHEDRIENYTRNYAPALIGIVPTLQELLDFDGYRVQYQYQPYRVAPGTLAIHGNKLTSTQNSSAQSAYKERMRFGTSIVQGHTHRLGLGYDTQERTRFWCEAGHLLDVSKADYLDFPSMANWQQGFGMLHVVGTKTFPSVHRIDGGRTVVHGKVFER